MKSKVLEARDFRDNCSPVYINWDKDILYFYYPHLEHRLDVAKIENGRLQSDFIFTQPYSIGIPSLFLLNKSILLYTLYNIMSKGDLGKYTKSRHYLLNLCKPSNNVNEVMLGYYKEVLNTKNIFLEKLKRDLYVSFTEEEIALFKYLGITVFNIQKGEYEDNLKIKRQFLMKELANSIKKDNKILYSYVGNIPQTRTARLQEIIKKYDIKL